MDSPRSKFVLSVNRHGFVKTVARSAYTRIRRLIPLEVCGVHVRNSEVHDTPHVEGYVTRPVESYEEFLTKLSPELQGLGNVDEAFTRNDLCIANFFNEQIVGYCFYTQHSTKVEDDVVFVVPAHHVYIYMARTATTHRGRRLDPERWKASQQLRAQTYGEGVPSIWYIDLFNYESLASNKSGSYTTNFVWVGYSCRFKMFGKWFTFRTRSCKRYGTGFVTTETLTE